MRFLSMLLIRTGTSAFPQRRFPSPRIPLEEGKDGKD